MHQFSRNYGLILKTFLYQVAMSLFGFMMYTGTYKIPLLLVVGQITILFFFIYIMFSQTYQAGSKACEHDWAHSLSSSCLLGFLFALIAFIPAIVLSVWCVAVPPVAADGASYSASYAPFLINRFFLQGMYIGISQWLFPAASASAGDAAANAAAMNSQCFMYLFTAIPGLLASGIGYLVGYKHFRSQK